MSKRYIYEKNNVLVIFKPKSFPFLKTTGITFYCRLCKIIRRNLIVTRTCEKEYLDGFYPHTKKESTICGKQLTLKSAISFNGPLTIHRF